MLLLLHGLWLVVTPGLLLLLPLLSVLETVLGRLVRLLGLLIILLIVLWGHLLLLLGLVVLRTGSLLLDWGGSGRAVITGVLPVDAGILAVLAVILFAGGQWPDGGVVLLVGGHWWDVDASAWDGGGLENKNEEYSRRENQLRK